ncbi:MAG: RimK family alpha-L-glutamate ligase [Actinomycetota bacterium]
MSKGPVVLVGSPQDAHVNALDESLRERGVDVVVADTLSFPDEFRISLGHEIDAIELEGRRVGRPAAVYVRDTYTHPLSFGVDVSDEMDQDWRRTLVAFREKGQMLVPVLARWTDLGVPMYNPARNDWRNSKGFQIAALAQAGLPVPETLWTNDPDAVRRFAEGRRVVYKPVAGGAATKELGPEDLTERRLRALSGAPVTFQELLEGDNFRVYCLDGDVVATIRVTSSAIDFRQNEDVVEETELPAEVLEQCLRAADVIGMRWTGMDLRAHTDGTLRFLELNSSPMFLGFDARAGTKIREALVSRLVAHAEEAS